MEIQKVKHKQIPYEVMEPAFLIAAGFIPVDSVCIYDTESDTLLWEDMGYYTHASSWSPSGKYLALARSARTWSSVTIIETSSWTSWEVTLPDGSNILEYTFLPDDEPWGERLDESTLRLIVGRGEETDGHPQRVYHCSVTMENGQLSGITTEE